MRRALLTLSLSLAVMMLFGCQGEQKKTAAPEPKAAVTPPAEVKADPTTWPRGEVFRVWPYGNGELMAYLGTRDGVRVGDILVLERAGTPVNTIEVLNVQYDMFFGRACDRHAQELWPREGDIAVRGPQPPKPEPVMPVAEEAGAKEETKSGELEKGAATQKK